MQNTERFIYTYFIIIIIILKVVLQILLYSFNDTLTNNEAGEMFGSAKKLSIILVNL